jgi:anti-anti-sigma factor
MFLPNDRSVLMYPAANGVLGLSLSSRTERGYIIAALGGELDIAAAPMLREKLLVMLGPAARRLIIDLSAISYADASGLAVLVATGRRARLLGGFLRLASPSPAAAEVLSITGLNQHLAIFPTVHAAITGPPRNPSRHDGRADAITGMGTSSATNAKHAHAHAGGAYRAADHGELRMAVAAVLTHADAWRDADPRRQFASALHALARANVGTSQATLTQAARSLLFVLTRHPLTHSPAVAATASRLRLLLDADRLPAHT